MSLSFFLPLKSYANIHESNALQTDWKEICPQPDFIIGNPPFVGKSFQTSSQKSDMAKIFAGISGFGNLDYVACWFKKAADFIEGTKYKGLIKHELAAEKWIRRYVGSNEFINNIMRYCLWLKDCPPNELCKMPLVMKRIEGVRDFRLASKKAQTRRRADTPTLFAEDRFVDAPAIIIPRTSSDDRKYIPMGFIERGVIVNLEAMLIPNGNFYTFGTLTSSIHMAWVRTVVGYLGTSYRYSTKILLTILSRGANRATNNDALSNNLRKKFWTLEIIIPTLLLPTFMTRFSCPKIYAMHIKK